MSEEKIKRFSYQTSVMDLYFDSISISDIKSSKEFFQSVKNVMYGFANCEAYILNYDLNENKDIKYVVENEVTKHYQPKTGEIQIFQMNIAGRGNFVIELDPKLGAIKFHTIDIGGQTVLNRITQNDEDIDFAIEDHGRPSEELLTYVVKFDDGSILMDSKYAYFPYSQKKDVKEALEEFDGELNEITYEWYESIFNRK